MVDGMQTGIIQLLVHNRIRGILIASIPHHIATFVFHPFFHLVNHGDAHGTKGHLAAGVAGQVLYPVAVLCHLHRCGGIERAEGSALCSRHLPFGETVVHILVHPIHTHFGQVQRIAHAHLQVIELTADDWLVVHIGLYHVAEDRVAAVDDSKAQVVSTVFGMVGRWVEAMERTCL